MRKKLSLPIILILALSLILGACGPTVETEAPVVAPTAEPTSPPPPPPTEVPEPQGPDYQTMLTDLIASIPADKGYGTVSTANLNTELVENPPFLLDVRQPSELESDGFIEGAVNIPLKELAKNLDKLPALDDPIVIYCKSGHRGAIAMTALKLLGYSNVRNLGGGIGAWVKAELPVVTGAMPEAPAAMAAPDVDAALLADLDAYLSALPDGFGTTSVDALNTALIENPPFLLDVRRANEFSEGRIAGAYNIPLEELMANIDLIPTDEPIVIYCVSGHRGAVAKTALDLLGFTDVTNLGGGINAWKAAGLPLEGFVDWNKTFTDYIAALPESYATISPANLNAALADTPPFLLDVREPAELESDGFIEGAVNIPVRQVLQNLDKLPALGEPIVIYCASGHRGALALVALQLLGYTDVNNLGGGLGAWKKADLPVVMGEAPAEAVAGEMPQVDETMLGKLDAYMSTLPEGFGTIKAADLNAILADTPPFILDVRAPEELTTDGYIEGSVNIPLRELFTRLSELPADKTTPMVVLCKSGHRGAIAQMALQLNGYSDVKNLGGGIGAWIGAELEVVK